MKRLLLILTACAVDHPSRPTTWIADTGTFQPGAVAPESLADRYRGTTRQIIAAAIGDRGAYTKLAELTDHIGHRLAGSAELEQAVAWAARTLAADGLDAHTERVMVPHWVRGAEEAAITSPIERPLTLLGLGGTIGTRGITAPVVVVHDWADLDRQKGKVKGAIVVYDVAMAKYSDEKGSGYGEAVDYRSNGASRAAKYGAVAALVRSVTAHSLHTPHTGAMSYDPKEARIPTAAITVEDATLLARLAAEGPVTVRLRLDDATFGDAESANVIGELRGREHPEQIVVIGGHLDSWDVGQGAHDDGAGVVMTMQALAVLRRLNLTPRRTIRVVLWTNEENGLAGAKAYAREHAAELPNTVLAIESDSGGFAPRGFSIDAKTPAVQKRLAEIGMLLAPLHAGRMLFKGHGADVSPMAPAGVLVGSLDVDGRTYFDIHHTDADTLDKVDPVALAQDVAAVAVLAYIAAELPERIDR